MQLKMLIIKVILMTKNILWYVTVCNNSEKLRHNKSHVFSQKVVTRHNSVLSKQPIKSLN